MMAQHSRCFDEYSQGGILKNWTSYTFRSNWLSMVQCNEWTVGDETFKAVCIRNNINYPIFYSPINTGPSRVLLLGTRPSQKESLVVFQVTKQ